jgi:hypothetical protein
MAQVPVVPVFINGLSPSDLKGQLRGNFDGTGEAIHSVFGEPIDFGDLMQRPASPKLYKAIAAKTMESIAELGQTERAIREANDAAHS